MSRLLGCVFVAVVAWWIAAALNVPVWRPWVSGDRSDIALYSAVAAYLLTRRPAQ